MTKLQQVIQVTFSDIRYVIREERKRLKGMPPYNGDSPELREMLDGYTEKLIRSLFMVENELLARLKSALNVEVVDIDVAPMGKNSWNEITDKDIERMASESARLHASEFITGSAPDEYHFADKGKCDKCGSEDLEKIGKIKFRCKKCCYEFDELESYVK